MSTQAVQSIDWNLFTISPTMLVILKKFRDGVPVDSVIPVQPDTLLRIAVENGRTEIVKLLLELGAGQFVTYFMELTIFGSN